MATFEHTFQNQFDANQLHDYLLANVPLNNVSDLRIEHKDATLWVTVPDNRVAALKTAIQAYRYTPPVPRESDLEKARKRILALEAQLQALSDRVVALETS